MRGRWLPGSDATPGWTWDSQCSWPSWRRWKGSRTSSETPGSGRGPIAWGLAEIAPLAVRRRFPLAVWLTILALVSAQAAVTGSNEGFGVFFGLLVGVYTVGAYTPRRTAVAVPAPAGAGDGLHQLASTGSPLDDPAFMVTLVGGFWAGRPGRLVAQPAGRPARRAVRGPAAAAGGGGTGAAAEQRERIARDVHDVVAHSVTLMVVQAEAGEASSAGPSLAECLRAIQRVGRSTLPSCAACSAPWRRPPPTTRTSAPTRAPSPRCATLDLLVTELAAAGLDRPASTLEEPRTAAGRRPRGVPDPAGGPDQRAAARRGRPRRRAGGDRRPDEVVVDVPDSGGGPGEW